MTKKNMLVITFAVLITGIIAGCTPLLCDQYIQFVPVYEKDGQLPKDVSISIQECNQKRKEHLILLRGNNHAIMELQFKLYNGAVPITDIVTVPVSFHPLYPIVIPITTKKDISFDGSENMNAILETGEPVYYIEIIKLGKK